MITEQDIAALMQILQRTPMSQAEILWCNWLAEKLRVCVQMAEIIKAGKEQ